MSPRRLIDLTHPLYDRSPSWPGDPGIAVTPHCTFEKDGCRVTRVSMGTHQGTHVDAPAHFLKDGAGIDGMALECFCGPARLLRIPKAGGERIDVADFAPFGKYLTGGARIVIHTGWDAHWGREEFCAGGPCLTVAAAKHLAARKIALLGVDMATPSAADVKEVHESLLGAGVTIVESLANLGECPNAFTLYAFPLSFKGLDGSPVRAVACA
jgi:arylformamidase